MRRGPAVLAATAAAIVLLPAGSAWSATHAWRVTAVLTGSYANDVTASGARCPAHYQEQVTGLRMTLRSPTIHYDSGVHVFSGPLRWTLRGRWHVAGQYTATTDADGAAPGCAPRPTPIDCAAGIVGDAGGGRVRNAGTARLAVDDNLRGAIGARIVAPSLTEQVADVGKAPAGWPNACHVDTDDQTVPVTPLFGLASTALADRALTRRILIPIRRLKGHRRFVLHTAAARPNGCPAQGFDPCAEQGSVALALTFRPAKR